VTLIKDRDKPQIQKKFQELSNKVKLLMFSQDFECEYCAATRLLLEELAALSDRLSVDVRDFVKDAALAREYGIDKIPATLVLGEKDYGIRFYGVPAGYEFPSLLEAIADVGRGAPLKMTDDVAGMIAKVDQPVRMQVLVTPT
jgi:alkyl hydroperoxide reductase subunit AhpF